MSGKLKGKRRWLVCIVISAVLLIGATVPFLQKNYQSEESVSVSFHSGEERTEKLGKSYKLPRGIYRVTVFYEAGSTNQYITAYSESTPQRIGCDEIMLERGKKQEEFQVWVSAPVEDFQVQVRYSGTGEISLSKVEIQELTLGKIYDLTLCLFLCAALFGGVWFFGRMKQLWKWQRDEFWTILGIIGITLLISIPLLPEGLYLGHDSGFHFLRMEGIWRALLAGQFPVRIQPCWLHDYGYAASVFYGDIFLYLPLLMRALGFSVQVNYELFTLAVNGITAYVTYYCLKKMFGERWIALAGSFLYTFSVYRFANVYVRNAVGEYCAMIFLPVIAYGFWCILADEREGKKQWIPLMIGFSGLVQTHMLSCEMMGLFAVLLCLILIRRVFQKERFIALVKATIGTLLLNAWFLIPFLDYMLNEHVVLNTSLETEEMIEKGRLAPMQVFEIFSHGMGSMPHGVPARIGLGLLLGMVLILLVLIFCRKEKKLRVVSGMMLGFSVISLWMTTNLFPWLSFKNTVLEFLTTVQFPWRFVGIATLFLVIGLCAAFGALKQTVSKRLMYSCMFMIMAGMAVSTGYTMKTFMETGKKGTCYEQRDGPYYVSGGEYLPADIELADNAFHPLEPIAENIEIFAWEKGCARITVTCKNELNAENVIEVPLLLYRGYHAYDMETKEEYLMYRTELGMTGICLPADYDGTVCMEFREPFYWRLSELLSLMTGVGIVCLEIRKRIRKG